MRQLKSNSFVLRNCFLREEPVKACSSPEQPAQYVALEHKVDYKTGFSEEKVVKDYPINSEYVTSFAAGVDYKRDLNANLKNGGVNLGDVRKAQALSQDSEVARLSQEQLSSQIKALNEELERRKSALNNKPVDNNNGEVNK